MKIEKARLLYSARLKPQSISCLNIILFLIFFQVHSWGADTTIVYRGSHLTIPKGFEKMNLSSLELYNSWMLKSSGMEVYEHRDQRQGLNRFHLSYDSIPPPTSVEFDDIVETNLEFIKSHGCSIRDISVNDIQYYVVGKLVMMGDTSFFGLSFDANGSLLIRFTASPWRNDGFDLASLEKVMKSIRHKSPYHPVPSPGKEAEKRKKDVETSGLMLTIGIVAFALVWLARKYLVNNES